MKKHCLHHSTTARDFFAGLLKRANLDRHLGVSDPQVEARVATGKDRTYLWMINPTRTQRSVKATLSGRLGVFKTVEDIWQGRAVSMETNQVGPTLNKRNSEVIRLR